MVGAGVGNTKAFGKNKFLTLLVFLLVYIVYTIAEISFSITIICYSLLLNNALSERILKLDPALRGWISAFMEVKNGRKNLLLPLWSGNN